MMLVGFLFLNLPFFWFILVQLYIKSWLLFFYVNDSFIFQSTGKFNDSLPDSLTSPPCLSPSRPRASLNPRADSDLEPFTTYQYRVQGWNSFGRGLSNVTTVTTSEDKPWGVAPPRWRRLSDRDDIIQLHWQAPARPNGVHAVCCVLSRCTCRSRRSK